MTLKRTCNHSCGCCDNSWSCKQLKKCVAGKYFEKKKTLNPNHFSVMGYAWITGVYTAYMLDRNSGGKTSQIEWLF